MYWTRRHLTPTTTADLEEKSNSILCIILFLNDLLEKVVVLNGSDEDHPEIEEAKSEHDYACKQCQLHPGPVEQR